VDLLDYLRPERPTPSAHGLGIGHLAGTDAGEVAIHQIGTDLVLQHVVAPIADMFEDTTTADVRHRHTSHKQRRNAGPRIVEANRLLSDRDENKALSKGARQFAPGRIADVHLRIMASKAGLTAD
jgi:hypothetical protein